MCRFVARFDEGLQVGDRKRSDWQLGGHRLLEEATVLQKLIELSEGKARSAIRAVDSVCRVALLLGHICPVSWFEPREIVAIQLLEELFERGAHLPHRGVNPALVERAL